jgi:predicted nucleic-acid-binding protein
LNNYYALPNSQVQEPQVVWKALRLAQKGQADFADFLIAQINIANGCGTTITFDNAAAEINSNTLLT